MYALCLCLCLVLLLCLVHFALQYDLVHHFLLASHAAHLTAAHCGAEAVRVCAAAEVECMNVVCVDTAGLSIVRLVVAVRLCGEVDGRQRLSLVGQLLVLAVGLVVQLEAACTSSLPHSLLREPLRHHIPSRRHTADRPLSAVRCLLSDASICELVLSVASFELVEERLFALVDGVLIGCQLLLGGAARGCIEDCVVRFGSYTVERGWGDGGFSALVACTDQRRTEVGALTHGGD